LKNANLKNVMKKSIFLFAFLGVLFANDAKAQLKMYSLTKVCYKNYDREMSAWTDWSEWYEAGYWKDYAYNVAAFDSHDWTLSVSPSALRITKLNQAFFNDSHYGEYSVEIISVGASQESVWKFWKVCTITKKWDPLRQRLNIDSKNLSESMSGTAIVKSNDFTWDELMSGNAIGDIYIVYTWENGDQNVVGYRIDNRTFEEIADAAKARQARREESDRRSEERSRQRQEELQKSIRGIGQIIQQRKRN